MPTFDLLGPLPEGTTVLEASAGTGKTHTVGALAARYVAEGVCGLDQMLIVTFGRAATRELRERVRDQLVEVAAALADPATARAAGGVVGHLATADDDTVALRRRRVRDALASFDAATIATTHQFCQTVLRSLGVAGDTDADVTLVEDLDDLVVEVVDDVYLAQYGGLGAAPLTHADALSLARRVVGDQHTVLTPGTPEIGSASDHRMHFAREVRREMDRRKRDRGVVSFDDLLSHLADALDAPGSPARERMLARWSVVLVDEFQDTDPVQWRVLQRAFDGDATLVLIGDPKQAIYAFRGGDIDAYLAAVDASTDRRTLGTNYRSDGPLVDALQVLTRGAQLGHRAITVQPIAAHHADSRLAGAPVASPMRVRVVDLAGEDGKLPAIGALREHIAVDLADDVARLLDSGATFDAGQGHRPVGAGDVAVLMRSLWDSEPIRVALADRGIPSVVADRRSVLLSPAADQWVQLLEALERQSPDRVRSVALTSFFGRSPAELDAGSDALTDDLAETVRDLLDLFRGRGVAAVREALFARGLAARVLAQPGGERTLTDLGHVGELLHDAALRRRLSLPALLVWLRDERRLADRPNAIDARQRRLDTDAAAVQIVTIHSSKGLQYPIVYLPHSFNRRVKDVRDEVALLHHEHGDRMLEIGRPLDSAAISRSRAEDAGEDLRLTYVALTRAQSQVVTWWGPSKDSAHGGLSRLLLGRSIDQPHVPASLEQVPTVADATAQLTAWQQVGGLVVEPATHQRHDVAPAASSPSPLTVRVLDRPLDTVWRRTSYSGLLRAAEGTAIPTVSEPEEAGTVDEDQLDDGEAQIIAADASEDSAALVSPMADLPAGAGFGSLVHAVLEVADPHASDLEAELRAVATEQLRWWPVPATADDIAHGLVPVHDTPLGPVAADLTLRDIGLADRLCELDFEFPLAGGEDADQAAVRVVLAQMADVLRRHLPPGDLLAPYADLLAAGPLGEQELRGYLSGSIDVVLRVPHGDEQRFVVVDYKTNRLGSPDRPLTAADYAPEHMAASMMHSHYPLQAMLYAVVLHRYLRWRLPSYDPAVHLGGVQYHYVRGMCGPQTPVVNGMTCGVFAWQPPAALVIELSDLLAGVGRGDP
ncbi:UvrD-helicase domain-containing protein [Aeromicrobium sp. CF3.5]|uniref:UvrD-helicase domain-containing protein n=1 Tax=Aeromicrobium sp. CF3.5 TaxID=3373078 RepID=UPI003EE7446A